MSTYNFLKNFLGNNCCIAELSQIYHHVYFKGLEKKYYASNDLQLSFVGITHEQLLQSGDKDFITDSSTLKIISDNDQHIIKTEISKVFIEPVTMDGKKTNFLSIKAPLYNENSLTGLCGISLIVDDFNLTVFNDIFMQVTNLLQQNFSKEDQAGLFVKMQRQRPKLTPRELDCLYLYMRGNSLKSIADLLNLSNRTIEFYIENIKSKFGVNKRSELLPMAFQLYPELVQEQPFYLEKRFLH